MLDGISAGDVALLVLVGLLAVMVADLIGAVISGQHRDSWDMHRWDTSHGFGEPRQPPAPRPLKHHARRVWRRTYTSRAIAKAQGRSRRRARKPPVARG